MEQVQVAVELGWLPATHPEPRFEEGPVEGSAVVGHQPAAVGRLSRKSIQQRAFLRMVRQSQLHQPETIAIPPAEAHQKGDRTCSAAQTGSLGVEAEQGSGGA